MEWLQSLLNSEATPALTAFVLGLLTAISPCPLATNIAAIGFIGRDLDNRRRIFLNGMLYALGRIIAYTALGVLLITVLRQGASLFGIQQFVATYGERLLVPVLLLVGLYMLFGRRLRLPSFGWRGNGEGLAHRGGWGALLLGMLFAMAFCPTSGIFYFGMLIPMAAAAKAGYLLRGHRTARPAGCLAAGLRHAAYRQLLRPDAEPPEMDESHRRHPLRRHRPLLLYAHLSVNRTKITVSWKSKYSAPAAPNAKRPTT